MNFVKFSGCKGLKRERGESPLPEVSPFFFYCDCLSGLCRNYSSSTLTGLPVAMDSLHAMVNATDLNASR